jgi:hypothetical protein
LADRPVKFGLVATIIFFSGLRGIEWAICVDIPRFS